MKVALKLVGQLWHYWELTGDVAEPCGMAQDVLKRADSAPDPLLGPALSGTGTMLWVLGRNAEAAEYHRRALESFRRAGNGQGVAWATQCLAVQASESGDAEQSRALLADVLNSRDAALISRVAAQIHLEQIVFNSGDLDHALKMSRDCVRIARELGDRWLKVIALVNLADCLEKASDADAAEQILYEAVTEGVELGAQGNVVGFLESLAGVYVRQGRFEPAIRLLGAADAYRHDRAHPLTSFEHQRIEGFKFGAQVHVGLIRFGLAWAEGQAMTLTQAIDRIVIPAIRGWSRGVAGPADSAEKTPVVVNARPW